MYKVYMVAMMIIVTVVSTVTFELTNMLALWQGMKMSILLSHHSIPAPESWVFLSLKPQASRGLDLNPHFHMTHMKSVVNARQPPQKFLGVWLLAIALFHFSFHREIIFICK